MYRLFISFLLANIFFFCSFSVGHAQWIDEWIQQKNVYGPGYISADKRGYVHGGNVSLRYQMENDHLFSVTPPRFKAGCGGIDIFTGGLSFLKIEDLINKFKNIMGPSSLAFTFDLALSTLSPQIAQSVKELEHISNQLNQLQLDDCKAQKAVVAYLKDGVQMATSVDREAISDFYQSTGLSDLYHSVQRTMISDPTEVDAKVERHEMVKGCPQDIRSIFFTPGSILENIASVYALNKEYVPMLRGILGDISIKDNLQYQYIQPCSQSSDINLDTIVYGNLCVKDRKGNDFKCLKISQFSMEGMNHKNIVRWVETNLLEIAKNIYERKDNNNVDFLSHVPFSVHGSFIQSIMNLKGDFSIEKAVNPWIMPISHWYGKQIFKDLLLSFDKAIFSASMCSKSTKSSENGNYENGERKEKYECQIELKNEAVLILDTMREGLVEKIQDLDRQYEEKQQNFYNLNQFLNNEEQKHEKIVNDVFAQIKNQVMSGN